MSANGSAANFSKTSVRAGALRALEFSCLRSTQFFIIGELCRLMKQTFSVGVDSNLQNNTANKNLKEFFFGCSRIGRRPKTRQFSFYDLLQVVNRFLTSRDDNNFLWTTPVSTLYPSCTSNINPTDLLFSQTLFSSWG